MKRIQGKKLDEFIQQKKEQMYTVYHIENSEIKLDEWVLISPDENPDYVIVQHSPCNHRLYSSSDISRDEELFLRAHFEKERLILSAKYELLTNCAYRIEGLPERQYLWGSIIDKATALFEVSLDLKDAAA